MCYIIETPINFYDDFLANKIFIKVDNYITTGKPQSSILITFSKSLLYTH